MADWHDPEVTLFTLDDVAEEREWGSIHTGVGTMDHALTMALSVLQDIVAPAGQVRHICAFIFPLFSFFVSLPRIFLQSLMARSQEKSQFLRQQKDAWNRLTEEAWLCGEQSKQLVAAHQKVAELAPAAEEVAYLQIREADACRPANKVEESFTALAKRAHKDTTMTEQLRKERDGLHQAMEELHREHDAAHQERTTA